MRFQQIHAELASKFIQIRRPSEVFLGEGAAQTFSVFLLLSHSVATKYGGILMYLL